MPLALLLVLTFFRLLVFHRQGHASQSPVRAAQLVENLPVPGIAAGGGEETIFQE